MPAWQRDLEAVVSRLETSEFDPVDILRCGIADLVTVLESHSDHEKVTTAGVWTNGEYHLSVHCPMCDKTWKEVIPHGKMPRHASREEQTTRLVEMFRRFIVPFLARASRVSCFSMRHQQGLLCEWIVDRLEYAGPEGMAVADIVKEAYDLRFAMRDDVWNAVSALKGFVAPGESHAWLPEGHDQRKGW